MVLHMFPDAKQTGEWHEEVHPGYRALSGPMRANGGDREWLFLYSDDRVVQVSVIRDGAVSSEDAAAVDGLMRSVRFHPEVPIPPDAGKNVMAESVR
jgi:hypothetical protein